MSSSNPDIFTAESSKKLKDDFNVQLCWKPYSWALQAAYARDRMDHKADGSFEEWLKETQGVDLSLRDGLDEMNKADDKMHMFIMDELGKQKGEGKSRQMKK